MSEQAKKLLRTNSSRAISSKVLSPSTATLKASLGNKENHKLPNNIVVDGNRVVKNVHDDHSGDPPYDPSLVIGGKKHRKSKSNYGPRQVRIEFH